MQESAIRELRSVGHPERSNSQNSEVCPVGATERTNGKSLTASGEFPDARNATV
jgi:hypothetical protein